MTARRTLIQALGFLIATCVLIPTFANAAAPKTKAEHIAIAEKYDQMAVDQDAITKEHNQMLKDYRANAHRYPKQVREKRIAEMKKHCTAIMRASKQLAKEYRSMAQWHRIAAEHLEDGE
ncbi:MAG: hypothetical protein KJO57_09570 [Deltaproteobacteria bacterium]|nr:hypothetical protein [Deltaproteobacteria bacterium]